MASEDPQRQESTARVSDRDLLEASPSTGWQETGAALDVVPGYPRSADALAAATREDRSPRYRRKHAGGRSS